MSVELKPCPFCGGQPKIHKTHKKFYVECDGDCWTQTGKHSYQEDAVKEWNTQIAVARGRQMTDHKFTDDDVIKAFERCNGFAPTDEVDCVLCPFCDYDAHKKCTEELARAIIDLINRQKAEIKMLKTIGDDKTSEVLRHDAAIRELHKQLETAKAEAIKEFAERLKANMSNIARMEYGGNIYFCVGYDLIDNLVKEMTEGGE